MEIFEYTEHMRRTGQPMITQFYKGWNAEGKLILMCMNRGNYGVVDDSEFLRAAQTFREVKEFVNGKAA